MSRPNGTDPGLSHASVQRLIRETELDLRARQLPPDSVQEIFRYGAFVGSTIERHAALARGMEQARALIRGHEARDVSFPSGWVILADQLTGGRGRFQRDWHAPAGGVWMTLVIVNTWLDRHARLLPLAAGVACCEALRASGVPAHVKWVNDVHVQGRKIAGILIESFRGPVTGEEYFLIGAGVNVNNTAFPPDLAASAVSAAQILGRDLDLDAFLVTLFAKFSWNIGLLHHEEARLLAAHGFAGGEEPEAGEETPHLLLDSWRSVSDSIGRQVLFGFDVQRQPLYRAVVRGIAPGGGILLERSDDGLTVLEEAGEIIYLG